MTRVSFALIAAAVAIAAPVAAPIIAQPAPPANDFADRLQRLDDMRRRAVLRGALVNSGQRCRRVEIAEPRGRMRNLTMWAARCAPDQDYGLFIGPDGSVQVRTCSDLVKLRLTTCRLPPRAATPAATRAASK